MEKFHTGISLMPLLPFISDTTEHLSHLFKAFTDINVNYILPATLTLFGSGKADSKTLVMNAIQNHFPQLETKYQKYFHNGYQMPEYYKKVFAKKMKELSLEYKIRDKIEKTTANNASYEKQLS